MTQGRQITPALVEVSLAEGEAGLKADRIFTAEHAENAEVLTLITQIPLIYFRHRFARIKRIFGPRRTGRYKRLCLKSRVFLDFFGKP
jgi:hypothetical protein